MVGASLRFFIVELNLLVLTTVSTNNNNYKLRLSICRSLINLQGLNERNG